ncbi:PilZ domain-containing protein [Alteromonas sp. a30]|uniref:PilZ domain-containing protein n=1 Tax=Alteromonas sp. a30 TaxID=2730917 RepID=UPI00227F34A0|nr:PilZ domain-containing protein [Alteromonas sp. a30]MCY7295912.1 PilZ domain-containing protein [Alteromonas sp. a30]
MNQDLEKYSSIIEKLKPFVNEPDFNKILNQLASNIPNHKRFLIKMELKRLARPCVRVIDLRGRVAGECEIFEYDNITHFLDETAREVFEKEVRIYGEYTLGVYEAVTTTENNFRVMQRKKEETDKTQTAQPEVVKDKVAATEEDENTNPYIVPAHSFAHQPQRSEERMNFAVAIELFSEFNQSTHGVTIDLSVNGLQFKTDLKTPFKIGEDFNVFFRGLEKEYALDKRNGIPYQVVKIETSNKEQRIGLKRIVTDKTAYFTTFLEQFIRGNKRRYKVNIDNTLQAIRSKTYEQYYIPNFTSIPVYIGNIKGVYSPRFVLTNDCNKSSIYYWANEHNELLLGYLLNPKRLTHAISKGINEFYVYVFNNISNDKVFFYSLSNVEVDSSNALMKVFQGFASKKVSWRMYKVQLTQVDINQSYRPLSLPNDIGDNVRKENQPPPPRLLARLKNVSHLALVTEVSDDTSIHAYQRQPAAKSHLPLIKKLVHTRTQVHPKIDLFRFKYQNLRVENRFQLRTPVIIEHLGSTMKGITDDVSTGGLRIELEEAFNGQAFSIINAAFPKLQGMTSKYKLQDLPYEVRNVSKDGKVLNLKTFKEESNAKTPIASLFFSELIKSNRSKLKMDQDEEEMPGMGEALKNIYANNVQNIGFFIRKDGVHLIPDAMTIPTVSSPLLTLFSFGTEAQSETMNAYPLYCAPGNDKEFIADTLKEMRMSNKPVSRELFIRFDPSKTDYHEAIKGRFSDTFATLEEQRNYIQLAVEQGQFYAIKIFIARTGRPDTDVLRLEMSYVNMYAQHKAKSLEQSLWDVAGVGDIIDITDEALRRNGFDNAVIKSNKSAMQNKVVNT